MAYKSNNDESTNSFFLDPSEDKEKFKERIADKIDRQVDSVDREEVAEAVDEKYEELLDDARVTQHIPTLTEGDVTTEMLDREKQDNDNDT